MRTYFIPKNTDVLIAKDDDHRVWKQYVTKRDSTFTEYRSQVGDVFTFKNGEWLIMLKMKPRDARTYVPKPFG